MKTNVLIASAVIWCMLVAPAYTRTWTDSTGKYKIEAELVEVRDGTAYLKRADGKTVSVPLTKLSETDRNYLGSLGRDEDEVERGSKPSGEQRVASAPSRTWTDSSGKYTRAGAKLVEVRDGKARSVVARLRTAH